MEINDTRGELARKEVVTLRSLLACFAYLVVGVLCQTAAASQTIRLLSTSEASPRIVFGVSHLERALTDVGYDIAKSGSSGQRPDERTVAVGRFDDAAIRTIASTNGSDTLAEQLGPEGFSIQLAGRSPVVIGGGDSGVLYGCLELARRVRQSGRLPDDLEFTSQPAFKLRGTCIGMQKTYRLPGRLIYEYPYTEELFPFFYDKTFWCEYLDMLAERRMNLLSLWNGHPFGSLVRLKDYPYAVEVSEDQFQRNVKMFRYITTEADKRGIWVTQMFYNILLPQPLAERHQLATQLDTPTPLAADYTRKAIAEFVKQYPSVGLHVCLGEAMLDVERQREWLTDVILRGVRDGMQQAGLQEEPPVMIRAHATDANVVIPAALKVYSNLYTESKYNGESLTTWQPRGSRQQAHQDLAQLGSMHVVNVHILANLEPFRYGAQRFIKRSVIASRDRLGADGLHVYPLCYWNWPSSADATDPPLKQIERDWIWFDAWARYAWDPDIDEDADREYWLGQLQERYGSRSAAELILEAYNDAGECAPRLIRRLGITEGNRQTFSLGMTLDQLVSPEKYNANADLWQSQAPPGERLQEYVRREYAGQPHEGETPPMAIDEALEYAERAVQSIDAALPLASENPEELARLQNDIYCIRDMTRFYQAKADAARHVLRHRLSSAPADLRAAADRLEQSLNHYRELVRRTESTYRFANSLQLAHRRIPVPGAVDGKPAYYHWRHMLPLYEQELEEFRKQLAN